MKIHGMHESRSSAEYGKGRTWSTVAGNLIPNELGIFTYRRLRAPDHLPPRDLHIRRARADFDIWRDMAMKRVLNIWPWSNAVPYEWTLFYAWYPVKTIDGGGWRWLCFVEVKMMGFVAPDGNLDDVTWYRRCGSAAKRP